jgi:hypothetical protein
MIPKQLTTGLIIRYFIIKAKIKRGILEVDIITAMTIREQLHKQIDSLPDDVVQQVADFTLFVMARRNLPSAYVDWNSSQWQDFVLGQFFQEEDEVEYSLEDAQEIYHQ